jgi:hypothetical protein
MDALAFMVRMRGGLEHLGFGGILKMLIRRYEDLESSLSP